MLSASLPWINMQPYREWTKHDKKLILRKLIQYAKVGSYDRDAPVPPEALLSDDDVKAMVGAADNPRDRALIHVLFETADRIAVMYLANIIEVGGAEEIFYDPKHPYTAALIRSIPSTVGKIGDVKPIPGPIPDPVSPPPGCRFHPRCQYAFDKCEKEKPGLIDIGNGRFVACHLFSQK